MVEARFCSGTSGAAFQAPKRNSVKAVCSPENSSAAVKAPKIQELRQCVLLKTAMRLSKHRRNRSQGNMFS